MDIKTEQALHAALAGGLPEGVPPLAVARESGLLDTVAHRIVTQHIARGAQVPMVEGAESDFDLDGTGLRVEERRSNIIAERWVRGGQGDGMSGHSFTPGRHRSFTHVGRCWYGADVLAVDDKMDTVYLTMGGEDRDGADYELGLSWIKLGDDHGVRVHAFDDSWLAFAELADVFAWLASQHGTTPSPETVCEALVSMGFEDYTEEVRP